jgi:hypothetical protein
MTRARGVMELVHDLVLTFFSVLDDQSLPAKPKPILVF